MVALPSPDKKLEVPTKETPTCRGMQTRWYRNLAAEAFMQAHLHRNLATEKCMQAQLYISV